MIQKNQERPKVRLRPHHIYCLRFLDLPDDPRGREFEEVRAKINGLFQDEENDIEIKEGYDFLCESCPYSKEEMCHHPRGNEEEVRKWDTRIIRELGWRFGQVLKAGEVKSLIKEKSPLDFCLTKCLYYKDNLCNPPGSRHLP